MGLLNRALEISESNLETSDIIDKKKRLSLQSSQPKTTDWIEFTDIMSGASPATTEPPRVTYESEDSESVEFFDSSKALASLLGFIQETSSDLEAPAELFQIIKDNFHVEKGSLLLLNRQDNMYISWAFTGYDKTTRHRLRLNLEFVNTLFPEVKIEPVILKNEDIQNLKGYFSIREFSLIEKIFILPFIYEEEIFGILLISDSTTFLDADTSFFPPFVNVFRTLSKIIYHSRDEKLKKLSHANVKSKDLILQQTTSLLQQAQKENAKIFFILFSIESLIETIQAHLSNMDVYHIQEDVLQVITSMMPETDNIFFVDTNTLLIILSGRYHIDSDLFIHQISMALKQLFSSLHEISQAAYEIIKYPEDISSPEDLIKRIFN